MKFETLRLMAQDYADRHKELQPLPAEIDTMALVYRSICQGEDPWTALGDFSNAWYGYAKHFRFELVKEPLSKPEQETEYTKRWAAFCAASVEYLCNLHHQPCPDWIYDSSYILVTPWLYTQRADGPTIQEHMRETTPPPFARRNIFCSNRLYQNKYEMYEWIQEAIARGMTDVHEIQQYGRQKEINLYGVNCPTPPLRATIKAHHPTTQPPSPLQGSINTSTVLHCISLNGLSDALFPLSL